MAERDMGGFATTEQLKKMVKDHEKKLLTGLNGKGVPTVIRKGGASILRNPRSDGSLCWPD